MGYNFGTPRLPLTEASSKTKEALESEMKKLGIGQKGRSILTTNLIKTNISNKFSQPSLRF